MERRKYNQKIQDKQKTLLMNKLIYLHSNFMLNQFNANLSRNYLYLKRNSHSPLMNTNPGVISKNQKQKQYKKNVSYKQITKSNIIQLNGCKEQYIIVGKKQLSERRRDSKLSNDLKYINEDQKNNHEILKAFKCCKVENFCCSSAFDRITKPQTLKIWNKNISENQIQKLNFQHLIQPKKAIMRPCSGRKQSHKQIMRPFTSGKNCRTKKLIQNNKQNLLQLNTQYKRPIPTPIPYSYDNSQFNPWDAQSLQNSQL